MAKKKEQSGIAVFIPKANYKTLKVTIVGQTRLVTNKFPHGAIEAMKRKQAGEKVPRQKRNPQRDYEQAQYRLHPNGKKNRYGFPASGIKKAMATAGKRFFDINKVLTNSCVFIPGEPSIADGIAPIDCVEIKGKPEMRTDIVRLAGPTHVADLRYRPAFEKWSIDLEMRFDADRFSPDTLVRLLHEAGQRVGIGEGRMEKGAFDWGMFKVKGLVD